MKKRFGKLRRSYEMFRATCLAMFCWHCERDKLHETFRIVAYSAKAKIVSRQDARAVAESTIKFYFSYNLSRNDFGHCRVCYIVKCFVQLVPPQYRQNMARKVARNISQCNSAFNKSNKPVKLSLLHEVELNKSTRMSRLCENRGQKLSELN